MHTEPEKRTDSPGLIISAVLDVSIKNLALTTKEKLLTFKIGYFIGLIRRFVANFDFQLNFSKSFRAFLKIPQSGFYFHDVL